MTGRDYIVGCHMMSNTLSVRTRTFHGGVNRVTTCRYCPGVPETPSHALQSCSKVRDAVTARHNSLLTKIQHFLTPNFDSVIREPWFNGVEGRMNPDLVLIQGRLLYVVDLTVPYDSTIRFMDSQAQRNVDKYQVLEPLLRTKFQVERVKVLGLAVGARGLYTQTGVDIWATLGLTERQRRCVSAMALKQSCLIWGLFTGNRQPQPTLDTGTSAAE